MIAAAHILTGAAVGVETHSFLIGGAISLLSHFVLDALPHIDIVVRDDKLALWHVIGGLSDFIIAWLVIFYFLRRVANAKLVYFCAFMAILPDIIDVLRYFTRPKFLEWYFQFHSRIQGPRYMISGVFIQAVVIIICLIILYYGLRRIQKEKNI